MHIPPRTVVILAVYFTGVAAAATWAPVDTASRAAAVGSATLLGTAGVPFGFRIMRSLLPTSDAYAICAAVTGVFPCVWRVS